MNVRERVGEKERNTSERFGTLQNIVRVVVKQQLYQLTAEVGLFVFCYVLI